jgi:pimeloyl-ACP methyl ester carboxylesterase
MRGEARSSDGIPLRFEARGSGTPALVFVHGWSCDRTYWDGQLDWFSARHQVAAMDLAGHGESGVGRQAWTMAAFGDDVVAVVEALGLGELVLIGHSMGGDIVVEAALRMPDRVVGLVWADVYTRLGEPQAREEVEQFLAPLRADFVTAAQQLVRRMFPPGADDELVDRVAGGISASPPEIAIEVADHAISNDRHIRARLGQLTAPVVAINPGRWPTDTESLGLHGVSAVIMPEAGHFPMMEDPDTFNRLLAEAIEGFKG